MTLPLLTYDPLPPHPPPNIFILKKMQDNQLPAGQTDSNDPAVSITIICFILFAIVHRGNHRKIRPWPDMSIIEKCFKQILKNEKKAICLVTFVIMLHEVFCKWSTSHADSRVT